MSDDTKRIILARRARFVAAAIAGVSIGGCDTCGARGSHGESGDATTTTTDPRPTVCLSPPVTHRDAGAPNPETQRAIDEMLKALSALEGGASADDAGAREASAPAPRGVVLEETTSPDAIPNAARLVRSQLVPRARQCHERALADGGTLTGSVVVRVTVAANGDVTDVTMSKIVGLPLSLVKCVKSGAEKMVIETDHAGAFEAKLEFRMRGG